MKTIILIVMSLMTVTTFTTNEIAGEKKAVISTEFGDMVIKLYDDTPQHRDNFIANVNSGVYDDVLFHRVMPFFMMQGGDPNSKNATPDQALGVDSCPMIQAEIIAGRFHKKGALAAARLPDNVNPSRASSGCQFFIVHGYKHNDSQLNGTGKKLTPIQRAWYKVRGGYPFLDNDYTIFGEVVEGLEVIDLVCAMPTHQSGALKDRPLQDVRMTIKMLN